MGFPWFLVPGSEASQAKCMEDGEGEELSSEVPENGWRVAVVASAGAPPSLWFNFFVFVFGGLGGRRTG